MGFCSSRNWWGGGGGGVPGGGAGGGGGGGGRGEPFRPSRDACAGAPDPGGSRPLRGGPRGGPGQGGARAGRPRCGGRHRLRDTGEGSLPSLLPDGRERKGLVPR